MRAVVQRVKEASVHIDAAETGSIGPGLLIYLGIREGDRDKDIDWMVRKLVGLRIFSDDAGQMNLDVRQVKGEVLIISQFTLIARTKKGTRPSYSDAARPETAIPLYEKVIKEICSVLEQRVQTGTFGADMKVSSINDGPVTIILDSRDR